MKNKESLSLGITVISVASIIIFGWIYSVSGTTIGANITTVDLSASGNSSTTGNFTVVGNTTLATTTIGSSGIAINQIIHGTVSINPPAINTSTTGLATSTVAGASAAMECYVQVPYNLNDDLVWKGCTTTANVIGVYLYNSTVVATNSIDDTATTWGYLLVK